MSYSLLLQYKGRAVLDPASFWSYSETDKEPPLIGGLGDDESGREGCNCLLCSEKRTMSRVPKWSTYNDIDPKDEKQALTPEHFILFPRKIMGFILKTREWGTCLLLDNCKNTKTILFKRRGPGHQPRLAIRTQHRRHQKPRHG